MSELSNNELMRGIYEEMVNLNQNLIKIFNLLSERSKLTVTQEITNGKPKKEYFEQDFKGITVMGETPKSWFIVKNGKQMYLAKQFIKDVQEVYPMGVSIDLEIKERADADGGALAWVKSKWEKYEPKKVSK